MSDSPEPRPAEVADDRRPKLHLSELQRIAVAGTILRPIRKPLGVSAFGINAYTGSNAGDLVIEPHDETGTSSGQHEELYVVMTGHAVFELAGEEIDAPAGTFVFAQPDQHRVARATAADTTILAIGGKPGAAGPPSTFEYYFLAAGETDPDRAYEVCAEGLEHHEGNASLHYNLACFAALAGRREDALRHIGIAFEADPKAREWARDDADLDSIRDSL
jgi:mannose-6-phosphate isomerase-like protein (cupin superfamily)